MILLYSPPGLQFENKSGGPNERPNEDKIMKRLNLCGIIGTIYEKKSWRKGRREARSPRDGLEEQKVKDTNEEEKVKGPGRSMLE